MQESPHAGFQSSHPSLLAKSFTATSIVHLLNRVFITMSMTVTLGIKTKTDLFLQQQSSSDPAVWVLETWGGVSLGISVHIALRQRSVYFTLSAECSGVQAYSGTISYIKTICGGYWILIYSSDVFILEIRNDNWNYPCRWRWHERVIAAPVSEWPQYTVHSASCCSCQPDPRTHQGLPYYTN